MIPLGDSLEALRSSTENKWAPTSYELAVFSTNHPNPGPTGMKLASTYPVTLNRIKGKADGSQ
ncbi:hypothetical protein KPSA3_01090 [Pseudomonas syringae pv. actinidiae]|uniref:Uncharacterized protein n=1 Tax=Pseudomonas syringae pv. actinidiae TaxID=103796 RepID=A0AAN4Q168_PSESF|nr:hypothetical protein KPSA3_01090 [Pseudomonas syringae pv. actinidiae]